MPSVQIIIDEAGVNTFTTASQQTLFSRAMEPDISGWVRAITCVRRLSDGASKSIVTEAAFKRASGNLSVHTVVLAGQYGSNADLVALSDCNATLDAVGTDLLVRVEGQSSEFDWSTVVRGIATQHSAT